MASLSKFVSKAAAVLALCLSPAAATSFTINTASTTAQTLGSGSGQTGTVTSAGTLTVSGSTMAVTISGSDATLTNSGTITQTGTGRVIRDNTGVTGLIVTNNFGALLQSADADVFQMNKSPASVTLNNYGTMTSLNASAGGAQAVDFDAIQSGSNAINNYSTGLMQAAEADGIRPGVNGVVFNAGTIKSTSSVAASVAGINAHNNSGVQITNDTTGLVDGAHHGITGGALDNTVVFTMSVTNNVGGMIRGNDGAGMNIDGFNNKETVVVINNGSITGNGVTGDGDGVDVDGLINLTNTGTIKSFNSFSSTTSAQSEGVTVGGGTIINSGTIEGAVAAGNSNATGRGITVAGVDTSGTAEPIYGDTSITNQNGGLIKGKSAGIVIGGAASGYKVTITNEAGGTIEGDGSNSAAIKTGDDNDTINNSGIIRAVNSGKAIDMGGGNNTLNITGGAASITGDINGGAGGTNVMTVDPGGGNSFSYAGAISNFSSVTVKSGSVTLSGNSTYLGNTSLEGGKLNLASSGMITSAVIIKAGAAFVQSGAIGGSGTGVTVQAGGSYYVTDSAVTGTAGFTGTNQYLDLQGGANVYFDIGGTSRGTTYDFITGLASFTLPNAGEPAHFNLDFLPSYVPAFGDAFDLVDSSSMPLTGGLFDFTGVPAGWDLDTSQFLTAGIVMIAPEPDRALLLLLGVGGLVCRRRRRSA
jgi:hypothetical protein